MLVVRKALGFVGRFPALLVFAHAAVLVLAAWLVLWSFGLSGVVARQAYELNRWWVIVVSAGGMGSSPHLLASRLLAAGAGLLLPQSPSSPLPAQPCFSSSCRALVLLLP